jgi:tetratricopeptide (TPR) repeat protein
LNPQLKGLKPADLNAFLQSLENQWQNVLRDRDQAGHLFPQSYCAYETKPTFGTMIVSRVYATTRCDLTPFPIDQNHLDIVKPSDGKDDSYVWAKARIQDAAKLIEIDVEASLKAYKRKHEQELAKVQAEKQAALVEAQTWEKAFKEAVQGIARKQMEPGAAQEMRDALAKLAEGETIAAEEIFRQTLVRRKAEGLAANREAAEAARNLGALAFLRDTQAALVAYREAVTLDPENADGWNQLGRIFYRVGDLQYAEAAFRKGLVLAQVRSDRTLTARAYNNLGHVYQIRGQLDQAEAMYQQSLALAKELGHKEVMASNYNNLGNVYQSRGELDQAEAMYQQSLDLFTEIGARRKVNHVQRLLKKLNDLQTENPGPVKK